MGDQVQSMPLAGGLKEKYGSDTIIDMLVSSKFGETAECIPNLNRIIKISLDDLVSPLKTPAPDIRLVYRTLTTLLSELSDARYDIVINLTHTRFSAVLTFLAGGKKTLGESIDAEGKEIVYGNWANYFSTSNLNRRFNRFNLVDINCRIGEVQPGVKLGFIITEDARSRAEKLLASSGSSGSNLIGMVPGASSQEKTWSPRNFAAVAGMINTREKHDVLVFGSDVERTSGDLISSLVPGAINLCGKTDIQLLAALLDKCRLVISNDTGPMHIAAAVGTRVIDISLGSTYAFETAPYGDGHLVFEPDINCYPCAVGFKCNHRNCQQLISPETVALSADAILRGEDPRHCIPGDSAGVKVHMTGFDPDGWWTMEPLVKRTMSADELTSLALREMWKRALDGAKLCADELKHSAATIGKSFAPMYKRTTGNDLSSCLPDGIRELWTLAGDGEAAARKLIRIVNDRDMNSELFYIGERLKTIDNQLRGLGYRNQQLLPLVTQFFFAKDSLTGWDIEVLADATAQLYHDLASWADALPEWMNYLYEGMLTRWSGAAA